MRKILGLTLLLAALNCFAQTQKEGPCKQIEDACAKAGFVKGEAKEGYGLWVDCIDPIMRGRATQQGEEAFAGGGSRFDQCLQDEESQFR